MVEEEASLLSRLFGMGATPPKQYFSFAIEIWEAFPLRRLHSVAPMWMTPEQVPDNGHFDGERWKQGLPARRGQIYRKILAAPGSRYHINGEPNQQRFSSGSMAGPKEFRCQHREQPPRLGIPRARHCWLATGQPGFLA